MTLLVRAAAKDGGLFQDPQLDDRWWWCRARWMIDELEREDLHEQWESKYRLTLAALSLVHSPEGLLKINDSLSDLRESWLNLRRPWDAVQRRLAARNAARNMAGRYIELFGDPESPEGKQRIRQTVEALQQRKRG